MVQCIIIVKVRHDLNILFEKYYRIVFIESQKVVFIMSDRNRIKFPFIMKDDHIPSAYEVVNNAPLTDEEMYLKKMDLRN